MDECKSNGTNSFMRSWSVYAGRFLGVEFRIHFVFVFVLLFILFLPSPRAGEPDSIARGVELSALILISAFLHELGHVMAANRNGRKIRGAILLPIGGVAVAGPESEPDQPPSVATELRIAVAGPMVNLFLAAVTAAVLLLNNPSPGLWDQPLIDLDLIGKSLFWINLGLFATNLLPAFPLDCGKILRAWLAQRMDYRRATRRAVIIGNLVAAAFILASVETQWMMLIGLVLFLATQIEERTVLFHSVAESVLMEDVMLTEFSTLSPADTLEDALSKAVHSLQDDFPVVNGADLVGVISRQTIVERLRRQGNGYIQGAMNRAFQTAARNESLASAFRKLSKRGLTLIPILDQDRLVGIVTLQNLMHSMGLLAEARRLRSRSEST